MEYCLLFKLCGFLTTILSVISMVFLIVDHSNSGIMSVIQISDLSIIQISTLIFTTGHLITTEVP